MESNPLLSALQTNYGDGNPPPADPNTVKGLLAYCKQWLDGSVEAEALNDPCALMANRLSEGANASAESLQANQQLQEDQFANLERNVEAYRAISDVLTELPELAAAEKTEEYREAIATFEAERQVVLDCQEFIQAQYDESILRCPGCGDTSEEAVCEDCQLVKMYPDPTILEQGEFKTGSLSSTHGRVFDAYREVLAGKLSLPGLFETLPDLEAHLTELDTMSSEILAVEAGDEELPEAFSEGMGFIKSVQSELTNAWNGVQRMRQSGESLQMKDLIRGWDQVFEASLSIQSSIQRYSATQGFRSFAESGADSE